MSVSDAISPSARRGGGGTEDSTVAAVVAAGVASQQPPSDNASDRHAAQRRGRLDAERRQRGWRRSSVPETPRGPVDRTTGRGCVDARGGPTRLHRQDHRHRNHSDEDCIEPRRSTDCDRSRNGHTPCEFWTSAPAFRRLPRWRVTPGRSTLWRSAPMGTESPVPETIRRCGSGTPTPDCRSADH